MKKLSPINKRRLSNFVSNKRGFYSFWMFFILFMITLFSDFIANEKPLLIKYENRFYYPIFQTYAETIFGGDFEPTWCPKAWPRGSRGPEEIRISSFLFRFVFLKRFVDGMLGVFLTRSAMIFEALNSSFRTSMVTFVHSLDR